jgi:hypothetical protein
VLVILVRLTVLERKTAENVVMPTEEGAPVKTETRRERYGGAVVLTGLHRMPDRSAADSAA